ncbi:MAG: HTTM domain-containing protein [Proteobacteria bacterium]|nr:HTTM domain-containing protein [Pseudomonadota bacterium]
MKNSKMKTWIGQVSQRVLAPTDVASVVLFRVGFGLLMFWEITRYFYFGWVEELFAKPQFHFQYEYFRWVVPIPGAGMYLLFAALGVLALMIACGLFYRVATSLFFLGYTYVFLLDQATYNNHFYLICLLSFVLILAPLNRSWSLDVLRGNVEHTDRLPAFWLWLWLIRFHMGLVYFYGGIAKFDPDWLDGLATRELLGTANRGTIFQPLMDYDFVHHFYAWSGLLFDLFIPFLMLYKPTRKWAFLAAVLFHTNNYFVFQIGIFPVLALVLTLIFFDADFPRKIVPEKFKKFAREQYRQGLMPLTNETADKMEPDSVQGISKTMRIILGLYVVAQLLLPFRHTLYPGWTSWHQEGHYFAWRMMLRQKITRVQFNVTHPSTGEQRYANPRDYLNTSQFKVFAGNPGMILLFAQHLDQLVQSNAGFDPIISARIEVSLNGREFRQLVDPNLDLSRIPAYQPAYSWIKPFGER